MRGSPLPTPGHARHGYLNTLADDSLRTVLQHLSDRPRNKNWHAYISPLLVFSTLEVGGALARVASFEFRRIGGDDGIPMRNYFGELFLRPLVYRLPLQRLVYRPLGKDALPDLLRGCGSELREFVLEGKGYGTRETDILSISTYCTKLSSLAIHGTRVEGTLVPIWRSLGSSLTRVYIGCYYRPLDHGVLDIVSIHDLAQHCVNLRRVDVKTLNDEIAEILVALGGRIRVLGVVFQSVANAAAWGKVYKACTNLEAVHLALDPSVQAIEVLSLMRTKLVSVTLLDLDNPMPTEDLFYSVLSACSALEKVELHTRSPVPEELLHKLYKSTKSVTTMACCVSISDLNPASIIDAIASSLTNLESISIETVLQLNGDDVKALVKLPHLKVVKLWRGCYNIWEPNPAEECAVEIVKKLKDCVQLVQLDIDDGNIKSRSRAIADAAVMYRRKHFDMFVSGVQYRTW